MKPTLKYSSKMLLLTAICVMVCAARKKPELPVDPKFASIANISVLPPVDARVGQKASVSLEKLQRRTVKALQQKRYKAQATPTVGAAGPIVEEDLQGAKPEWARKLGPPEARWVMVVCLGDVISKITFGSTGNAHVSGYLFDKETGETIWKAKGVGQAGQGGLAGMMLKGTMKSAALDAAVYDLIAHIPTLPKPKK